MARVRYLCDIAFRNAVHMKVDLEALPGNPDLCDRVSSATALREMSGHSRADRVPSLLRYL